MDSVTVLLSSYNGEQYISEQIESILSQKGVSVNLIVRDDGSKDTTPQILNEYQEKGKLIVLKSESNLGFAMSFLTLLKNAPESDYYAFADQDDIWLDNKLSTAIEKIKELDSSKCLYCSNLTVFRDNQIGGLMRPVGAEVDEYSCLNRNISTGCTIVFDSSLKELVLKHIDSSIYPIKCHDLWLFHTALYLGTYYYDDESHILYRQHSGNQIGAKDTFKGKLLSKRRSFKNFREQRYREEEANNLLNCYNEILSNEQKEIIKAVAYYRKSFFSKLRLICNRKYDTGFYDKMRILLGIY